jgi:hypothetical protein
MSRRAVGRDRKRRVAVVTGVMLLIATILVLCLLAYRPAHIRGVSSDAFERSVAVEPMPLVATGCLMVFDY